MRKQRQVALMFPMGQLHHARLLHGVTDYISEHGHWTISVNMQTVAMPMQSLKGWPGDGVIGPLSTMATLKAARELEIPIVNISGWLPPSEIPRVIVDNYATGRLAAEHLLERGFKRFAYCGLQRVWFSQQRERGFVERIRAAGYDCQVWNLFSGFSTNRPWYNFVQTLEQWLETLKPPVGLMAVHDHLAHMFVDACLELGIKVPHEVSIIGVDNNDIICNFSQVSLSSVSVAAREVGYQAAALLDRMMEGEKPPQADNFVMPDSVVSRRSTDMIAVENHHLSTVIHFIHDHVGEMFGMEAIEQLVPVSRRWLERRFRQELGCTPHEYICRVRVERAKQLLTAGRKMPMHKIARACGFGETKRLRLVFQRITGITPSHYRRLHATAPNGARTDEDKQPPYPTGFSGYSGIQISP